MCWEADFGSCHTRSVCDAAILTLCLRGSYQILYLFLSSNSNFVSKKSANGYMSIRAWNILAMAALLDPSANWSAMLFAQLHNCSYAHRSALRVHGHSGTVSEEMSTADINHAYITIKLWMMLAQKVSVDSQASNLASLAVWNELWPPFESLLSALENEARAGPSLVSGYAVTGHCHLKKNVPDPCITDHIVSSRPSRISTRLAHSSSTAHFNSYRNIESPATSCFRGSICNQGMLKIASQGKMLILWLYSRSLVHCVACQSHYRRCQSIAWFTRLPRILLQPKNCVPWMLELREVQSDIGEKHVEQLSVEIRIDG